MSVPKVTVLLTVYNRPSVKNTIESILAQTFTDFEFLIVDNCSTDDTVNVIRSYNDSRIRLVINEKNYGQTYSLNKGLELATGEYIARIDADDLAVETRLEKQVRFLDDNPEYGLCGTWVQYINDSDYKSVIVKMPSSDEGFRLMQEFACAMYHPSVLIRKSVLTENSLLYDKDISMAEDYDLWYRISKYTKCYNIPEVLVYYRIGNNDSATHEEAMFKESLEIRSRLLSDYYADDKEVLAKTFIIIDYEKKDKKSLLTIFKLYLYFVKKIKKISYKDDVDILKFHFYMHLYAACIVHNKSLFSKFIKKLYGLMRNNLVKPVKL